jgi:hypothetical protein
MKKAKINFNFILPMLINVSSLFSQSGGFNPLDPLGPEYGGINPPIIDEIGLSPFEGNTFRDPAIKKTHHSLPQSSAFKPTLSNRSIEQNVVRTNANNKSIPPKPITPQDTRYAISNLLKANVQSTIDPSRINKTDNIDSWSDDNEHVSVIQVNQNSTDLEQLEQISSSSQNDYAKIQSFDSEALNFSRFKNSKCYDKIGFSPNWDMNELERKYCKCEDEYRWKIFLNVIFILFFILTIGVVVYYSFSKEKRSKFFKNL